MEMSPLHPLYQGHVECLLFCGVQVEGEDESNDSFTASDLAPETVQHLLRDCADFIAKAGPLLDDLDLVRCGNDLHYDREGHGTGFLDRDNIPEAIREALHDLAQHFGQLNAYVANGLVYLAPDHHREFEWPELRVLVTRVPELPRYHW